MRKSAILLLLLTFCCHFPLFSQELIFEDHFDHGMEHWVTEKWEHDTVMATIKNGQLLIRTKKGVDGIMVWNRATELPENFRFEFDFTPLSSSGFFLLFFCQQYEDGADILSRLNVVPSLKPDIPVTLFNKYVHGPIRGYHISFRRNRKADCNFRKNPGLHLLKKQQLPYVLKEHKTVHIVLTKNGNRFTLQVDGKLFTDSRDEGQCCGPVYSSGRIGFRQVYDSEGAYDNVRLWRLR